MNMKYWLFAATLASVACLPTDDKEEDEDEEEEESEPSGEPSSEASTEPSGEPSGEPAGEPSYAYITQSYAGDAVVTPGTGYEGTESLTVGVNDSAGTGNFDLQLVWNISGTSIDAPAECNECQFSFDLQLTFDADASTDPNGDGSDMAFGYALGTGDYGTTLFYGGDNGWGPWLADGQSQADLNGTEHAQVVSFDGTNFTYTDGIVDFYYYY